MNTVNSHFIKQGLKHIILTTTFTILVSLSVISQAIGNPTVLNSMSLSNITPTSATLNWMYRSDGFDSAPVYTLYSRNSSQTFYKALSSVSLDNIVFTSTPQSKSLNVTGLQPNTTYTWFLNVIDEANGMTEPRVMENFNNGVFLGLSILTASTYQLITFTTLNANGTGGTSGSLTTVTNSIVPPNQLPVANAGPDVVLPVGGTGITLNGLGSFDNDGGIRSFSWGKTDGPAVYSISSFSSPQPTLSNLTTGTYTFQLTITDSRFATSRDFVTIVVNSGNQPPIVNAGPDQTITLPANSVHLNGSSTDGDGTIAINVWSVISGPAIYGLISPNSPGTAFTNLQQGIYSLQLRATDNSGSSGSDTVLVTVNAGSTTCINDNFESNNTLGTAATINTGIAIAAKICPLTDVDFFKFNNRNAQRNIRVKLFNLPTNYVLQLFAPNGSLIGTSNTANAQNKVILFNTTTVGTYKIKVSAGIGASVTNISYSLLAEISRDNFTGTTSRQSADAMQSTALKSNGLESFAVDIYPNPATNVVNVHIPANQPYSNISVFDISGQLIKSTAARKNITPVNIADLSQGIYIVKVITASGKIFSKKIVVIR